MSFFGPKGKAAEASSQKVSGSNAAETFGATNGGVAPGTKVANIDAAVGKFLIPLQVRGTITGTAMTNAHATVRFVTDAPANRDSAEGTAGATQNILNLGAVRVDDGSPFVVPAWAATEDSYNLAQLLTDGDKITKIEVYARRSNTTDAISWTAQIVAAEIG